MIFIMDYNTSQHILISADYVEVNQKIPSIVVGQTIFCYLDVKTMASLEIALASTEQSQTLCYFLAYLSKIVIGVHIPRQMTKLIWLRAHGFPIKTFVHLDKMKATFSTSIINEIVLVDNSSMLPLTY